MRYTYLILILVSGWLFSGQPSTYSLEDVYKDCVLLENNIKYNPELYFNTPRSGQLQSLMDVSGRIIKAVDGRDTKFVRQQVETMLDINNRKFRIREEKKESPTVTYYYFTL